MNKSDVIMLWDKYHVPLHMRRHMEKVAYVCNFLALRIESASPSKHINSENLIAAALLHDIAKVVDLNEYAFNKLASEAPKDDVAVWKKLRNLYHDIDHAHAGDKILKNEKLEALGMIVKKHGYNAIIATSPEEQPQTLEEKILYYADKRVMHDKIVTLRERLQDGRKRYFPGENVPAEDARAESSLLGLEKEICSMAAIEPSEIVVA